MELEKLLPVDADTERLVLGAMLTDPDSVGQILDGLGESDFALRSHRLIYSAARKAWEGGEHVDRVTVAMRLQDEGSLETVGGLTYISTLDDGLPKIYGLDDYVDRLARKATLRAAAQRAYRLVLECCEPSATVETISGAEQFLRTLRDSSERGKDRPETLEEFLTAGGASLDSMLSRQAEEGVFTPWSTLNEMTGGFRPGQLVIVAGRPGDGKTVCAVQLAMLAARRRRAAVLFSLEMTKAEIWKRILSAESEVSFGRINFQRLNDAERAEITRAAAAVASWPLFIDDDPNRTVRAISAALRKHRMTRPLDLVVIDYMQLLTPGSRRENRTQEITEISRGLKLLAKDMGVPVVVLSQLSRDSEKGNRRPELSDLRDSGSIEQDADIVLMLYREPKEREAAINEKRPSKIELLVRKQRNGPTGSMTLMFDPRVMSMMDQ